MKLEIGKLYKVKLNGCMFFRHNTSSMVVKNNNDIIMFLGDKKFLDTKNNVIIDPPTSLLQEPLAYLYLFV